MVRRSLVVVMLPMCRLRRRRGGFGWRRCRGRSSHVGIQRNGRLRLVVAVTGWVLAMRSLVFALSLIGRVAVLMSLQA